jgi:O-antigen/teichoic acid export membrane protein
VWVGLGQAVAALAGLVGIRLLTSFVPPAVYGEVVLLLGIAALGTNLFCGPFQQAVLRFYPQAREAGRVGALRRQAGRVLAAAALLLGSVLLAAGAARSAVASFAAVAALVAVDTWRTFESGLLNGERRQRDYMVRTGLDAWGRWLVAAGLAWFLGATAFHVLGGMLLGSGLANLLLSRRVVRGEAADGAGEAWAASWRGPFFRYALPLVPLAALNWVFSMGDRYVLAAWWDMATAGVYVAAYGLASQPFIALNAVIHSTLRPVLYDAVARGDAVKERRTLRVWVGVVVGSMGLGWLALALLARPVCALLLGARYQGAAALVPVIAGAYALQAVQQTFEIMLYAHGGTGRLTALQAVAAAVSLVLYVVLIPEGGARGAALATLWTFVITTTVAFFLARASARLGIRRS